MMEKLKMMFDKENWSPKKFSWYYAILMVVSTVLFSFLFLHFNIIGTSNLRYIYVVVIIVGTLVYIRDFTKHRSKRISFTKAFIHCARTGIYTCIALIPVIIAILLIGLPKLDMVDEIGKLNEANYPFGFMFSRFLEISSTFLISSFLGAFIPGMMRGHKTIQ